MSTVSTAVDVLSTRVSTVTLQVSTVDRVVDIGLSTGGGMWTGVSVTLLTPALASISAVTLTLTIDIDHSRESSESLPAVNSSLNFCKKCTISS